MSQRRAWKSPGLTRKRDKHLSEAPGGLQKEAGSPTAVCHHALPLEQLPRWADRERRPNASVFDAPSNYTVEAKGAKRMRTLSSGDEENRATAMPFCTANRHKSDPSFFKRKSLPAKATIPENAVVQAHPKGQTDMESKIDRIDSARRKKPGASLSVRSTLELDPFQRRISQNRRDELTACSSQPRDHSGRDASRLQLLDICLNEPIEDHACAAYDWLVDAERSPTLARHLKKAALDNLAECVHRAWNRAPMVDSRALLQKVWYLDCLGRRRRRPSVVHVQ